MTWVHATERSLLENDSSGRVKQIKTSLNKIGKTHHGVCLQEDYLPSLINYFLFLVTAFKYIGTVYGNILNGVKMCLNSVISAQM